MAASKVLRFEMNDASLKRKIAEIAADSSRVVILPHAKKRMRQRHVLITQVLYVLRRGYVVEPAHLDIHGCWKCTLECLASGDRIKVAAAIDKNEQGELVVVITVMA